jgi:hypothetical protein
LPGLFLSNRPVKIFLFRFVSLLYSGIEYAHIFNAPNTVCCRIEGLRSTFSINIVERVQNRVLFKPIIVTGLFEFD